MIVKDASEQSHLPTGEEIVAEWEEESSSFDFDRPRWHSSMFCILSYNYLIFSY